MQHSSLHVKCEEISFEFPCYVPYNGLHSGLPFENCIPSLNRNCVFSPTTIKVNFILI